MIEADRRRDDEAGDIRRVAHVVSAHGLSDAFGHVSARASRDRFVITPPRPLGQIEAGDALIEASVDMPELPDGAPKEAWIHAELYRRHPEVGGIVRAQPRAVAQASAAALPLIPLSGHAAMLGGEIPVHSDSRLIRDAERARAMAERMGGAAAIVLRGNGTVTVGRTVRDAAAATWVLERTAELVVAAGTRARALPHDEVAYWSGLASELLPRIYSYLEGALPSFPTSPEGESS